MFNIKYPPEYIFPANPNIANFVDPIQVVETYKENGSELNFITGFSGRLNVIKTKYAPYFDKTKTDPQLILSIEGNEGKIEDITPYYTNSVINFTDQSTGIYDEIKWYFDGINIVTNYDFTNVADRLRVTVTYYKIIESLRVKALFRTNTGGISFNTPVADQYTLIVDKQRIIN